MRKTITISVSDEMQTLIYLGRRSHHFSTVSEYIRYLVHEDQKPNTKTPDPYDGVVRTANQVIADVLRDLDDEDDLDDDY